MLPELYRRFRTSPFGRKITKYALGSLVALLTSVVVFALLLMAHVGTTIDSVAAFVAGAIPNWILNRRWAWEQTGKVEVAREVVGYVVVSLLCLVAAAVVTGATQHWVRANHIQHGFHTILVTGSYVFVQVALFVVKFVIYDRWVFAGRSRVRAALRSRHQVWVAARANRTP
jgi:putative flippase GtrA